MERCISVTSKKKKMPKGMNGWLSEVGSLNFFFLFLLLWVWNCLCGLWPSVRDSEVRKRIHWIQKGQSAWQPRKLWHAMGSRQAMAFYPKASRTPSHQTHSRASPLWLQPQRALGPAEQIKAEGDRSGHWLPRLPGSQRPEHSFRIPPH